MSKPTYDITHQLDLPFVSNVEPVYESWTQLGQIELGNCWLCRTRIANLKEGAGEPPLSMKYMQLLKNDLKIKSNAKLLILYVSLWQQIAINYEPFLVYVKSNSMLNYRWKKLPKGWTNGRIKWNHLRWTETSFEKWSWLVHLNCTSDCLTLKTGRAWGTAFG